MNYLVNFKNNILSVGQKINYGCIEYEVVSIVEPAYGGKMVVRNLASGANETVFPTKFGYRWLDENDIFGQQTQAPIFKDKASKRKIKSKKELLAERQNN